VCEAAARLDALVADADAVFLLTDMLRLGLVRGP
jgi:hypothetical protein